MLTDATLLQKLWDKGVDIGSGVITSIFVGGIGLLLWKGKLWLDLRAEKAKREQQHAMEDERERLRTFQEARERRERLAREREAIGNAAESAENNDQQADLLDRWFEWMHTNALKLLPRNVGMMNATHQWSSELRRVQVSVPNKEFTRANAERIASLIRQTQLSAEDNSNPIETAEKT